ncbi:MAG: ferredoxin domain-containing protein, partial [Candidatus Margulisbacteria bacterium]|nr:ferredoxin domain-containing protein [Candidatus Margulisiibacteriota bacterium]
KTMGLRYCSFCGQPDCAAAEKAGVICAYNSGDLGIAIGSAVSVAMDRRVDNRVMYSVGKAAIELKLLGEEVVIAYGIPLSASAKNPFFDRK